MVTPSTGLKKGLHFKGTFRLLNFAFWLFDAQIFRRLPLSRVRRGNLYNALSLREAAKARHHWVCGRTEGVTVLSRGNTQLRDLRRTDDSLRWVTKTSGVYVFYVCFFKCDSSDRAYFYTLHIETIFSAAPVFNGPFSLFHP